MCRTWRAIAFFLVLGLGTTWLLAFGIWKRTTGPLVLLGEEPEFDLQQYWGAYSPYFSVEDYTTPPHGCEITQVNILQRHGARFPTFGAAVSIASAVQKLQSVDVYTHPAMDFLPSFVYTLGINDLVPFGAQQSFDSGALVFERYSHLIDADNLPFVRASSGDRVVQSARNWTQGFSFASHHVYKPRLSVILSEEGNNTLENHMCPNAGSSDVQTAEWLAVYAPATTARLNSWAPGANLTDPETYSLISLCAFHTIASATEGQIDRLSPFCDLFAETDFEAFEYSGDLDKYYGTGYGDALGPVQGVGYTNELIARLTRTAVHDHTQTNATLDADPATFPLNRTIYADFSHDNTMIAIFSAMGLFPQPRPLATAGPDVVRTWRTSWMVPFAGRMVVEKMACGVRGREYVRILVNDAVQPLEFCAPNEVGVGLCELSAFVQSQAYARNNGGGDWEKCFS
ncbi:histidine phosphatase superfamily [Mycena sp. CBHHK59/15]|nr:histidine phosphatase superfamily [Mycena sp. CBHHK59/15]